MAEELDYRQRLFDRYASLVDRRGPTVDAAAARRWGQSYRSYLRGWLPKSKTTQIADVGCGAGSLLLLLKEYGYTNLHGVDLSPEQVALARQVCQSVEQGSATEFLEQRPGHFGLILAVDVVEHLPKSQVLRFLNACAGALQAGGRLVLQTPNAESPVALGVRYGDFSHEICFNPGSLSHMLALCGLEEPVVRELGPVPRGVRATCRWVLWRILRRMLWAWNLVETGSGGSGVYTRVFMASACKPV